MQLHHHHPMEPNPAHQLYSLFTRISIFCITILILTGYSAGKQCRNCGSAVVPYPLSTSTGCGDPNYRVFCNTTTGVLYLRSINGSTYPITSIDPQSQRFIIQPARFVGNSCRTSDIVHNGAHLDENWPFNFTTENTVFLLNCSSGMLQTPLDCASSSLCSRYLRQASDEAVSCRNSSICCTTVMGGSLFSYGVYVKDTRCTAYKSFVNLNTKLPIKQWPEGLQVQWRLPPELECRNQTDCLRAVSNSTCRKDPAANGTILRCFCNSNHRWDPVTGACIDIPRGCLSSWSCHKGKYIALISGLTSAVSLLLMFGLLIYRKHRLAMEAHSRLTKEWEEILSANSGGRSSKLFSGRDMKNATNNFSKDRLLGAGGFGEVYMGFLQDGTVIAVKIAKVHNTKGTMQVLNEVSILSQVNHRSLVRLLGCCVELERPAMVYEFIPNGTLYDHIYTGRYSFLNWHQRLRIAHQTAEGLAYLHSSAVPPIYHRDVKSSNILLDEKCNAKVSDFGLSRIIELDQTHVSTCAQGTIGYLDPEYYRNYQLTDKSDVFSFGVVLLELLTSKRVIDFDRDENDVNLVAYVQHRVDEGRTMEVVDENLKLDASQGSLETMKALCSLALTCLEERRQNRPSMIEVVEHIEYIIGTEQTASIFLSRHG